MEVFDGHIDISKIKNPTVLCWCNRSKRLSCSVKSVCMSTVVQSVPQIFIKDSAIGVPSFTPFDMCSAVNRATNASSSLEGVQKINGLWRLYFKDRTTRLQLCNKQHLLINGVNVPLHDSNPYTYGHWMGPKHRVMTSLP